MNMMGQSPGSMLVVGRCAGLTASWVPTVLSPLGRSLTLSFSKFEGSGHLLGQYLACIQYDIQMICQGCHCYK